GVTSLRGETSRVCACRCRILHPGSEKEFRAAIVAPPVVSTMAQNSGGHGHTPSPVVHGGSHHHSRAFQSHGSFPSVMSGHNHTAATQASAQGQQQFQRLKVSLSCFILRFVHFSHHLYYLQISANEFSCQRSCGK
uniref:Uncharacterized protein n=1 Tax=Mola mola TaxID=94237 RepID=A0A3Q3VKK1_MOLML